MYASGVMFQVAALTLCQILASEANCIAPAACVVEQQTAGPSTTHLYPPTPMASEGHTPLSETSLPTSLRHRKHPTPLVVQLVEMGFARKQVEYAIRMMGRSNTNLSS